MRFDIHLSLPGIHTVKRNIPIAVQHFCLCRVNFFVNNDIPFGNILLFQPAQLKSSKQHHCQYQQYQDFNCKNNFPPVPAFLSSVIPLSFRLIVTAPLTVTVLIISSVLTPVAILIPSSTFPSIRLLIISSPAAPSVWLISIRFLLIRRLPSVLIRMSHISASISCISVSRHSTPSS